MLAIFVDQAFAFYRTIRSLVLKGGPSDEAAPLVIRQFGFDDTQTRALTQSLFEDSAFAQAKVPVQFQEVIADILDEIKAELDKTSNRKNRDIE